MHDAVVRSYVCVSHRGRSHASKYGHCIADALLASEGKKYTIYSWLRHHSLSRLQTSLVQAP